MNFLIKTQFVSYYSPAMLAYINWYLLNESSGVKDPFVKNLFVNYKNSKRLYTTLQAKQTEFLDLFIYECRAHGKEAWVVVQNDLWSSFLEIKKSDWGWCTACYNKLLYEKFWLDKLLDNIFDNKRGYKQIAAAFRYQTEDEQQFIARGYKDLRTKVIADSYLEFDGDSFCGILSLSSGEFVDGEPFTFL